MRRLLLLVLIILPLAACHRAPPAPYAGGTLAKLTIVDQKVGTGPVAKPGMEMVVQYTGWLYDEHAKDKRGKEFDSTLRHGSPFEFVLGTSHVIQGWNQGVKGMRVGGVRTIMIPPELAYGSHGAGGGVVPPNAPLVFRIKLLAAKTP